MSTAYILDGFELFFTDLTKKKVINRHIFKGQCVLNLQTLVFYILQFCTGLKKMVFIHLIAEDKTVLEEAIESLKSSTARQTQCWKRWSLVKYKILYGIPLWWKRRSFNSQDLKEPEPYVKLRGVRPLSDDDLNSVKYSSKLHVSSYIYKYIELKLCSNMYYRQTIMCQ